MNLTNNYNIPFIIKGWLSVDDYDYISDPKYISATTLLKPIKQIVLSKRVPESPIKDWADLLPAKIGTGIHDSIEKAWTINKDKILEDPTMSFLKGKDIRIEERYYKTIEDIGFTVGGKFDFVVDGHLFDIKTTSTYTYINDSKKDDYILQGSIYKYLCGEEIIKDDFITIIYIFTDWSSVKAKQSSEYPQIRCITKDYPLLDLDVTERLIKDKLNQINTLMNAHEDDIPECSDKDLWRDPPKYKYYTSPTSTRATKVFDNYYDANAFFITKGKGIVKTVYGEPVRCRYCSAQNICKQYQSYLQEQS